MALNITLDGFCYLNDGSTLADSNVRYQAYFRHINSGSSPSKWNNIRVVEGGTEAGYYSLNLGDGDFLTQDGSAGAGDVVVVVFWRPITAGRLDGCGPLVEWGAFMVLLGTGPGRTSDSVYTNAVQVKYNICPNLSWSMPSFADVYQVITATNSSTDTHQWDFGGVTMWQRNSYYTTLQTVNAVDNSDYDWDDGSFSLNLSGATNGSHFWTTYGDYDVQLVIEDECGCTVTGTKPIRIYWREPVCGITCHQANGSNQVVTPDTVVTFAFDGTNYDNNITGITWKINDSGAYGDTDTDVTGAVYNATIHHTNGNGTDWCGHSGSSGAFTNPGTHKVEIWIAWWDGFDSHVKYCSETFTQLKFSGPAVDFDQDPDKAVVASGVKFVNTSTNTSRVGLGLFDCDRYDWTFDDNGTITTYSDKPYSYDLEVTPQSEFCTVRLCADWSDGWDTQTTCVEKDVIFRVTVDVEEVECFYGMTVYGTADDGSVGGYHWDVYRYTTYSGGWLPSGPTELIWETPINMDQKYKELCFTQLGWYKLVGWVYPDPISAGGEASAYYDLEVTFVCPDAEFIKIPVCEPNMVSHEIGDLTMKGKALRPNMRAIPEETPCCRIIKTFPFYIDNL